MKMQTLAFHHDKKFLKKNTYNDNNSSVYGETWVIRLIFRHM